MFKLRVAEYVKQKLRFSAAGQAVQAEPPAPGVFDMTGRRIRTGDTVSVHDSTGAVVHPTPSRVTGVNPTTGVINQHKIDRSSALTTPLSSGVFQFRVIDPLPNTPPVSTQGPPIRPPVLRRPRVLKQPTESNNATNLPPADINAHQVPDPLMKNMKPEYKLKTLYGAMGDYQASSLRESLTRWAGKPIHDQDIMDMMGVPRVHPLTKDPNHPGYLTNLEINSSDSPDHGPNQRSFSTTSASTTGDYEYGHENKFRRDENGNPYIYVSLVEHGGDLAGGKEFSMPHILWNMATAAHRNGVKQIKLHAALGGGWVGGLYWPKMGFDQNLSTAHGSRTSLLNKRLKVMNANPEAFGVGNKQPEEYTVQDMLSHPQGYASYFKENKKGDVNDSLSRFPGALNMTEAHFDTDPNSRSMKILANYLRKIEARGKK